MLQEVLLDFHEIPGVHSGENMACLMYGTLEEMGISEKVSFSPATWFPPLDISCIHELLL